MTNNVQKNLLSLSIYIRHDIDNIEMSNIEINMKPYIILFLLISNLHLS